MCVWKREIDTPKGRHSVKLLTFHLVHVTLSVVIGWCGVQYFEREVLVLLRSFLLKSRWKLPVYSSCSILVTSSVSTSPVEIRLPDTSEGAQLCTLSNWSWQTHVSDEHDVSFICIQLCTLIKKKDFSLTYKNPKVTYFTDNFTLV